MVDFRAKMTIVDGEREEWTREVYVNGSTNKKGSLIGVILEGLGGILLEYYLKFGFHATNNQVEYVALTTRLKLTKEVGFKSY